MDIKLLRKSGHQFFEFVDDGVSRVVCVDGWINSSICPSFCHPHLEGGWQPLYNDRHLDVFYVSREIMSVVCPTCFGYVSRRGAYRKVGSFHVVLDLDKTGLSQFLYDYTF